MKNKILKGIATLMAAVMLIGTAAVIPAQEAEAWTWADSYEYLYPGSHSSWLLMSETERESWVYRYLGYWPSGYPTWTPSTWSYDYNYYYYYNTYVNSSVNSEYTAADQITYGAANWDDLSDYTQWKWVYDKKGYNYFYYYYGYPYNYYYYYGYPYYGTTLNIVSTETEKAPAKTQNNNVKTTYMSSALVDKALKLIKNCESGENVTITMGKATHIDSDIMAALQGRNVTVYAKKGAYSWFINGKDIKDSSIDANIACTVNAGNIPEKLTKKFKGETVEISTVANSLTFKGYLYASIGYEGDKVDVYKYDGETLKKIATVTVDSDDEAGVKVTTGGDYLFVVK